MNAEQLKQCIRTASLNYAHERNLSVNDSSVSAILFATVGDNLHPKSYARIQGMPQWWQRTLKAHPKASGYREMQSSNSSEAILMSIFAHPELPRWKKLHRLLGAETPEQWQFGFKAEVRLVGGKSDRTEVDLVWGDAFVEAKLTERNFTSKPSAVVQSYEQLDAVFELSLLERIGDEFVSYQIIRNLIAAHQHERRHILLCDDRRSDLVRLYYQAVGCLRSSELRNSCRVVFWQEVASCVDSDLAEFLSLKYGIA